MNAGPCALAFNKAHRAPGKPRRPNHRRHFPQPHMGVGKHQTLPRPQRRERVLGHHRVGAGQLRRIEAINTVNHEVLVCLKVQKIMSRDHTHCQRAFTDARKPAQHHAIEPCKSLSNYIVFVITRIHARPDLYAIFTPFRMAYALNLQRETYDEQYQKVARRKLMDILYVALIVVFTALTLGIVRLGESLRDTGARK